MARVKPFDADPLERKIAPPKRRRKPWEKSAPTAADMTPPEQEAEADEEGEDIDIGAEGYTKAILEEMNMKELRVIGEDYGVKAVKKKDLITLILKAQ